MTHTLRLPGLDVVQDVRSQYGDPAEVHLDCLTRFPDAVLRGVRRELERLERAGIPAFADGRYLDTPQGRFAIRLDGQLSARISDGQEFLARARRAVRRMQQRNGYSFNKTFARQFVEEGSHA